MKNYYSLRIFLLGFLAFFGADTFAQWAQQKPQVQQVPDVKQVNQQMAAKGLRFTENKGQVADLDGKPRPDILFTAQNDGVKLFLKANGIHYQFRRDFTKPVQANEKPEIPGRPEIEEVDSTQFYRLDLSLQGSNPNPEVVNEGAGLDVENFFLSHCPDGIIGVKNYNRITYKEVYPNIDWVVYIKEGKLEYDFVVRPGGNAEDIKMQYNGADNLALDNTGALSITTPLGKVTEQKPFSFQQDGREIESRFVLAGNTLGFEVPDYNENKVLTIDPSIVWATYYGGSNNDLGRAVATDGSGNIYLAGYTKSSSGIASGGYQNTILGVDMNAFLVKFNASGVRQWATYYGAKTWGHGVATDLSGNVYLQGTTGTSTGIASGGHQNTYGGGITDAFLVKFNSEGSRIWATYYGGVGFDYGNAVACDNTGNVFLSGFTVSTTNIGSGGHQNTKGVLYGYDFLVKFNANGMRQWGTYYGGDNGEHGGGFVATDAEGNAYLAGPTSATTSIAYQGHQNTFGGGSYDAYLVKFNTAGVRQWATYFGGSGSESNQISVATDALNNVIIAGFTSSASGIAFDGHQNTIAGGEDAFLVKFNAAGVRQWATYYGGSSNDYGYAVATDGSGNVHLAGYTGSTSGIASGGFQNIFGGDDRDAFLVKFNASGVRQWGTYYGGSGKDHGYYVATNTSNDVFLAGYTNSTSAIASNGHQNTYGGGNNDAFLVKISEEPQPDADGDGVPDANDCAPEDATKYRSENFYIDKDNDGYDAGQENVCYGTNIPDGFKSTTLGTDCDDENGEIGSALTWYRDSDNDGYSNGTTQVNCNRPTGYKLASELIATTGDCSDANPSVYPGAPEICDNRDNDCNGQIDEGVTTTWYKDSDNDGYSNGNTLATCNRYAGYKLAAELIAISGDCQDDYPNINPAATEVCDGMDNDCDGIVDFPGTECDNIDSDGDGFADFIDCAPNNAAAWRTGIFYYDIDGDGVPGKDSVALCYGNEDPSDLGPFIMNPKKFDCNDFCWTVSDSVFMYVDRDYDGYHSRKVDLCPILYCNPDNPTIPDNWRETTNGEDCNDDDEYVNVVKTWYKDKDLDGYGDGTTLVQCLRPSGGYYQPEELYDHSPSDDYGTTGDCNDENANIRPGATEICDGLDNDCDGQIDEGCPVGTSWYRDYDKDGYGNAAKMILSITKPKGYVSTSGDCRDWDAAFHPGATELCDGKDNDCDGQVDEGCNELKTWYYDKDKDGYGNPNLAFSKQSSTQPKGYVDNASDCRDWDATCYPGATELCDGKDNDCDGIKDEDCIPITQPLAKVDVQEPGVMIFPNPARDEFVVTLQGFEVGRKVEMTLAGADGKLVSSQSIAPFVKTQQVRIDVRNLHAGIYLLQVRQGALLQTKKVVVAK